MSDSCSIKLTLALTHKHTHAVGTKPNLMIFISMKTQDKQNATRSQWPRSRLIITTRFLDDSLNRSATCSASCITLCILGFFFLMTMSFVMFSQEQWLGSFLYHGNRQSCLHWPGAALTLLVVLGLLCCFGSQPQGRWELLVTLRTTPALT